MLQNELKFYTLSNEIIQAIVSEDMRIITLPRNKSSFIKSRLLK
ncbi:MAG: hypothetical protein WA945_07720 [Arcobacteraceae bacterium]